MYVGTDIPPDGPWGLGILETGLGKTLAGYVPSQGVESICFPWRIRLTFLPEGMYSAKHKLQYRVGMYICPYLL